NTRDSVQHIRLVEEDMDVVVKGYKRSMPGSIAYWALVACTVGILYVVDTWFHVISIWFSLRATSLEDATYIQVCSGGKHLSLETVDVVEFDGSLATAFGSLERGKSAGDSGSLPALRIFAFRHHRFVYHPILAQFISTSTWKDANWSQGVATGRSGLCQHEVEQQRKLFGKCVIDIEEKSYGRLLWEEVLNPFYVFQIASIVIWSCEDYYYYAACIFAISAISVVTTLISTKRTVRKIRQMSAYTCPMRILRDHKWQEASSGELVPGDIFDLSDPRISVLPCEAVVLEGDCIVNESMLTGESVPESKSPLEPNSGVLETIDMATHTFKPSISRHVLFAGTQVVRVRKAVSIEGSELNVRATAMVLRTGFNTTKGTLVRSILFPRPTKFRFYRDAFRFVGVLAFIAVIGFIVNTINLHRLGVSTKAIAKKALDLITVVVPPALPASMSIGMAFAARRLRKEKIFCISPSRINVASKVAVMCFDKTGTLTEEGLDLLGVRMADQRTRAFVDMRSTAEQIVEPTEVTETGDLTDAVGVPGIAVIDALATCHSLRLVGNQPVGDPLEAKMLEFTGWQMEENDGSPAPATDSATDPAASSSSSSSLPCSPLPTVVRPPQSTHGARTHGPASSSCLEELGILRCFEFSPALRRASVVAKRLHSKYAEAYVKGAPEVIRDVCLPETLPADFDRVLGEYTQSGYRVIALAGKPLKLSWRKVAVLERDSVECDLVFMGFIVFENRLKPATAPVLSELREARIRMVMCTGDNPLTAVSVARECSLIAPGVRVFVPHLRAAPNSKPDSPSIADTNRYARLAEVAWRESMGHSIALDPVSLVPHALDTADPADVQLASELAQTGRYCVAVTGDVFDHLHEHAKDTDVWKHVMMRGTIFARMSPEQKAEMIEHLQSLGYISGFCGDGANDCGALKSADVGISLSEAEASVAAPFTSHTTDIRCVPQLIKEGRCSIATSFSCFKYMALYSMVQFTTCCLLYIYNVNLTDGQYLYVDLFTILPVAIFMDRSRPFKRLVPKRPSASLTSKKVLTSLIGNIILVIGFQIGMYFMIEAQRWYVKQRPEDPTDPDSVTNEGDLNTSMFLFTMFQYLFVGVIFNIGPPYRQPSFRNYGYMAVVLV
ncbi:hypothetical protein GQ54DRAFT_249104, partial [Martensiomyces pterosporus]